jgi:carbamoyl-phosphate synthase large subunit
MRILVSGIASDIGFNCARVLRGLDGVEALYGTDIQPDHAGPCLFDACAIAPRAVDPGYEKWLLDFLLEHRIDFFLPTSEAELARIAGGDMPSRTETRFIMANRDVIDRSLDKHRCLKFLADCNIPVPANGLVGITEPLTWPVVVKPRSGQGSKGVTVADSIEDFRRNDAVGRVWQELLLPEDAEYTCPVYRSPSAGTRLLILRRTLQGGLTGRGEVVESTEISDYVDSIANAMDLHGAMNVQLRLTHAGPRLFEINPRLSSTVMFRHIMGFRDLEWWLIELAGLSLPDYKPVAVGTRFYRGSQEYFIRPE